MTSYGFREYSRDQVKESISALRRDFFEAINSGVSSVLMDNSAGLFRESLVCGSFADLSLAAQALGPMTMFTQTAEVIDEFDAIQLQEVSFGNSINTHSLMIGYHQYPGGVWKIWNAIFYGEISGTDLSALLP